jgi:hypothetical protein
MPAAVGDLGEARRQVRQLDRSEADAEEHCPQNIPIPHGGDDEEHETCGSKHHQDHSEA